MFCTIPECCIAGLDGGGVTATSSVPTLSGSCVPRATIESTVVLQQSLYDLMIAVAQVREVSVDRPHGV